MTHKKNQQVIRQRRHRRRLPHTGLSRRLAALPQGGIALAGTGISVHS